MAAQPVMAAFATALALALAGALAGCEIAQPSSDAPSGTPMPTATGSGTQTPTGNERPSPPAAPEAVSGASATALEAIRNFTVGYINWSGDDVAQRMRSLAAESIDQARSAMELAAAQTAADYELRQGGIANSGTVEAIAPLADGQNRYVVVTRETTSASNATEYQGLRPAWHVALVSVAELGPGRWVVSRWQPEN